MTGPTPPTEKPSPDTTRHSHKTPHVRLAPSAAVAGVSDMIHHADHRLRPDFRRAILGGLLALASLVVGVDLGGVTRTGDIRWAIIGLTVAFVVFAALAIRSAAGQLNRLAQHRAGLPAASALRTVVLMVGAIFILLGVMELLSINLREILLGGAITGVIFGIAAQQPLGNFFAGLVLLFARPYVPGEPIRINCGAIGGPFDGRIIYGGLMYSVLETDIGRMNIPNLQLMTAAIGPIPPQPADSAEPADEAASAGTGHERDRNHRVEDGRR